MKTMRHRASIRFLFATAFALALAEGLAEDSDQNRDRTVQVSVAATDSSGGRLRYRWRSTDGTIANVNAPSTTWTLPPGPGLHYAYVLVSNGRGGYTERRVAVSTDDMPWADQGEGESGDALLLMPPPAPAQVGDYMRGFIALGTVDHVVQDPIDRSGKNSYELLHDVYAPDLLVALQDPDPTSSARYPAEGGVPTNSRGEYVVPGVPRVVPAVPPNPPTFKEYNVGCSADKGKTFQQCTAFDTSRIVMLDTATPNFGDSMTSFPTITGTVLLGDGSPCGVNDEFFGVHSHASAILQNANHLRLAGPVPVNEFGDFALPNAPGAAAILLRCEGAPVALANTTRGDVANGDGGYTLLTGVGAPEVRSMDVRWNGQSIGKFLPPPGGLPPTGFASNIVQRSDGYLASKGVDSRRSACQYYKAVGAVGGCDERGNFTGAVLTYTAWQHSQGIGPYARRGAPQYEATYINRADLNLTRVHTSISYGPQQTAAVVCNHLGPPAETPDQLLDLQPSDADRARLNSAEETAILNAAGGRDLVACVAMDYYAWPGVNDDKPFVRFLIFGPSGALLPSVNLDGRGEKFMPGTCVVCHGGDHYQGQFPQNGSGFADIGGHFLPYDIGNFKFVEQPGLKQSDQEESIYHLNQIVLQTGPTVAEMELIAGWYKNSHVLDIDYLPDSWKTPLDPAAAPGSTTLQTYKDFYLHVIARSCRTCHTAMIEAYNFDHEYNIDQFEPRQNGSPLFPDDPDNDLNRAICGGHEGFVRDYMMPNSLVTYSRLWASAGTGDDQVAYMNAYLDLAGFSCGQIPRTDVR